MYFEMRKTFWKPHPLLLIKCMLDAAAHIEKFTINDVLFVGDSETDRIAAKNAGIDFCWAWDFFNWPTQKPKTGNEE